MKKVIGMVHCSDLETSLREIAIYQKYGLSGALVENYFGSIQDVIMVLDNSQNAGINLGINILGSYKKACELTKKYDLKFIQVDAVAGNYRNHDATTFQRIDSVHLYGGVWPKYYFPVEGSDFEADVLLCKERANGVVITGAGTGMQTPLDKLQTARSVIGNHELIVGAGITIENALEQLSIADGCIIGTYFKKDGMTRNPVDEGRVAEFMQEIKKM